MAISVEQAANLLRVYNAEREKTPKQRELLFNALHGISDADFVQALKSSAYSNLPGSSDQAMADLVKDFRLYEWGMAQKTKGQEIWEKVKGAFVDGKLSETRLADSQHAAYRAVNGYQIFDVENALTANGISQYAASNFALKAVSYNRNDNPLKAKEDAVTQERQKNALLTEKLAAAEASNTAAVGIIQELRSEIAQLKAAGTCTTAEAAASAQPVFRGLTQLPVPAAEPHVPASAVANKINAEDIRQAADKYKEPSRKNVAAVQAMLKAVGYEVNVDGMMGPKTRKLLDELGTSESVLRTLSTADLDEMQKGVQGLRGTQFSYANNKDIAKPHALIDRAEKSVALAIAAKTAERDTALQSSFPPQGSDVAQPVPALPLPSSASQQPQGRRGEGR